LVCGYDVVYVCAYLMYLSVGCLVDPTDKYLRYAHT